MLIASFQGSKGHPQRCAYLGACGCIGAAIFVNLLCCFIFPSQFKQSPNPAPGEGPRQSLGEGGREGRKEEQANPNIFK